VDVGVGVEVEVGDEAGVGVWVDADVLTVADGTALGSSDAAGVVGVCDRGISDLYERADDGFGDGEGAGEAGGATV
jgi:hypothetical protein